MSLLLDEFRLGRDGLRYGFAVGKVRVLSTRLLDRSTLERLVDAPHFAEQKRILSDSVYGRYLEHARTPADVEQGLDRALDSVYGFLTEAGLSGAVVRFFHLRFDYANLKAALKAGRLSVPVEELLVEHGLTPKELFEGPLDKLPEPLASHAARLTAVIESEPGTGLGLIDLEVDRAFFADLHATAADAKSRFLTELAARQSDIANLKIVVRAHRAQMAAVDAAAMFVPGGKVKERDLIADYKLPFAEMIAAMDRRMALKGALLASIDNLDDLDVIADNAVFETIRRAKRAEPGAEDVIAYVRARESEVQILRVALLGKMAGLDPAAMHRRMRASLL